MDNYYNLDSLMLSLFFPSVPLVICVNGIYYLCHWSMNWYDNETKKGVIVFTYELGDDGSLAMHDIRLNCYWTDEKVVYDEEEQRFKMEAQR